jgi:8-oxo-dGTP diphosphatase
VKESKILCVQRGKCRYDYISFKYEFPGGKVEPGEKNSEALMRELKEEMDMEVEIIESDHYCTVTHDYPDYIITMHAYICRPTNDHFKLYEHIDFQWLSVEEIKKLDWAAADIPIAEKIFREGI